MPRFTASHFVQAHSSTPEDKARFANQLLAFLLKGCPREAFSNTLYTRLSMCFGHIAHYDREGFYEEWFSSSDRIADFIQQLLEYPAYGDPAYTYSDVEKALKVAVRAEGLYEQWRGKARQEQEAGERALLSRLKAKYEPAVIAPVESKPVEIDPADLPGLPQAS